MFKFYDFTNLNDGIIHLKVEELRPARPERGFVPAYLCGIYLCDSNTRVGFIDIRIGHSQNLYYGGTNGYTVFEEYRGNNYAVRACKLIKQIGLKHGMNKLYITCNPDNYSSKRVCEKLNLKLLEIAKLPEDNDMYLDGDREKCIFEWILDTI